MAVETPALSPPRRRRRRVAVLLLSTVVALLGGEFAARWQIEGSFGEAIDSVFGLRTAAEPGTEAGVVADDELGFVLSPRLSGMSAQGVRHPWLPQPKPAGEFRLFLLGDSVGFPLDGFFAELTAAWVVPGEPRQVVNACVHGYTTWQERRYLERDLLPLQPDLVVLQYCVNDNYRMLHRLTSKGRRLVTAEAKNYLFPDGDGWWPWLARSSYLVYSVRKVLYGAAMAGERTWHGIGRAAWTAATWVEQREHLQAMAAALAGIGARLAVVAVPHEDQLDPVELARDPAFVGMPQRELAAICRDLAVPYLDLHPILLPHRELGLFVDRLHLSPAGHRRVGAAVVEFLRQHELVRPAPK